MSLVTVGAVVGIAGGLNSMGAFGDGGSGQPQSATGGSSGQTGVMNEISPQMLQAYQAWMQQNPQYAENMQIGGNMAGNMQTNAGQAANGYGMQLGQQSQNAIGAQQNLQNAGSRAFASAIDPQTVLYNHMLQGTQDAANAGSSMRGIGMSPEAAGITNQATNNFNQSWNNNMVQNAATGANAMSGAYNAAGNQGQLAGADMSGGVSLMNQGANLTQQGGATPWNTANTIASQPFNIGSQYAGTMNTAFNPQLAGFNQSNSAAGTNALLTGGGQFGNWLNSSFGSSGNGGSGSNANFPAANPGDNIG